MSPKFRPQTRTIALALLLPYLVALGLIVFLPAREAGRVTGLVGILADGLALIGLPREPTAIVIEFVANIVLFVPFGTLVTLAWPRLASWTVICLGAGTSAAIELVQLGIPSRVATVSDVIANTAGTAVGCLAVVAVLARTREPATG